MTLKYKGYCYEPTRGIHRPSPALLPAPPQAGLCLCITQFDITFKQLKKFKYNFNIPHLTVKQNNFAFPLELLKFSKSRSLCINTSLSLIKDLPSICILYVSYFQFPQLLASLTPFLPQASSQPPAAALSCKSHLWCRKYPQA